ncbi:hypothetical protein [Liberiplasma polymorphum]|uniref:McrB family protein n=1 Tax=Liberiplasma polymorphum TaxID=3374570 RepID=UPI00377140D2
MAAKKNENIEIQKELTAKDLQKMKQDLVNHYNKEFEDLGRLRESILLEKEKVIIEKSNNILRLDKELSLLKEKQSSFNLSLQAELVNKNEKLNKAYSDKIASLNQELEKLYKVSIDRIEKETKNVREHLAKFVEKNADNLTQEFLKLSDSYTKLYDSRKQLIDTELNHLIKTREDLEVKMQQYVDIDAQKEKLKYDENLLNRRKNQLENQIDNEVEKRHKDILIELNRYKEISKDYEDRLSALQNEHDRIIEKYTSTENIEKVELKKENIQLKKEKQKLVDKYAGFTDQNFNEIQVRAKQAYILQDDFNSLQEAYNKVNQELFRLKNEAQSIDTLKFQNETLTMRINTERLHLAQLKDELSNLKLRLDNELVKNTASESIEEPLKEFRNFKTNENTSINEVEWIKKIQSDCEASGFKFSERLFYSFHTSLKTSDMSPLTVLAGVSGTGKSKLPQLYSRFGGLYFLSLPVQPDWDSPQSLFGYFNSIEKRFNSTTLLRALVAFQKDKSESETKDNILDLSDKVLIVLLDEMNLAHVELYFSDLLSKLEERRGEDKEISFEVDLGAKNGKYHVYLTSNVLWAGTMNEDETTKSLSDKVIDRGNVISFPRPTKFESYNQNHLKPMAAKIDKKVWEDWINCKANIKSEFIEKYKEIVLDINKHLRKANRALGHRVWQSIENYLISHPLVMKNQESNDEKLIKALNYAFEEALVHKVITKLRGIETEGKLRSSCLDPIKNVIDEHASTLSSDFEYALQSITGTFIWDSSEYLNINYELEG